MFIEHCRLKTHLNTLKIVDVEECRFWETEDETPTHLLETAARKGTPDHTCVHM